MNLEEFLNIIKRKRVSEIIIDWIFVLVGVFLVYDAIYLIYAYHFTGMLFLFMLPMTTLVSQLVIGLVFIWSGVNSILDGKLQFKIRKVAGIMLVFYPINQVLLDLLSFGQSNKYIFGFVWFALGVLIYRITVRTENKKLNKESHFLRTDWKLMFLGIFIYILIDLIFYNWNFLDRVL
ncbi:hypothetical protein [Marinifilum fragile]|uniref:hypothetical protein n=1 Tax=Marinifilum fragile TaxID=570161 RepID=UPI002AA6C4D2|nr:hypothetical protein [Marinifilum fragile]